VALAAVRETLQATARAAWAGRSARCASPAFEDCVVTVSVRLSPRSSRMKTFFVTSLVGE